MCKLRTIQVFFKLILLKCELLLSKSFRINFTLNHATIKMISLDSKNLIFLKCGPIDTPPPYILDAWRWEAAAIARQISTSLLVWALLAAWSVWLRVQRHSRPSRVGIQWRCNGKTHEQAVTTVNVAISNSAVSSTCIAIRFPHNKITL